MGKEKKWKKCMLQVLRRSEPEERTLDYCKMQYGAAGGPGWGLGCKFDPDCMTLNNS